MTPSMKEANKELSKLRCVYTVIRCTSDCSQGNRGLRFNKIEILELCHEE